jgi:hypothetical protein
LKIKYLENKGAVALEEGVNVGVEDGLVRFEAVFAAFQRQMRLPSTMINIT